MPLQVIEAADSITEMIRFHTSTVFEMMVSLHNVVTQSHRHRDWIEKARAALPPDFLDELDAVYGTYSDGVFFFELAISYADQNDVPGFTEHIREMNPVQFAFYLVGRAVPVEEIAKTDLSLQALRAITPDKYGEMLDYGPMAEIFADIPAFQNRLADLWERYWEIFFRDQATEMRTLWENGIQEKERLLSREGGAALFEHITGWKELPSELPEGYPVTDIVFIPIMMMPSHVYIFYGYGNVTIMFDCRLQESRTEHQERMRVDAINVFKALSDDTRLKILRLITLQPERMHGKVIAEKVGLSASAVSRHIGVLKDGDLIAEEPCDGKITYRLNKELVQSLSDKLLDYLYS
ncbi:MAG: winged helix-turn-helix transcriptional regulator [Anaerolineae bacterium]|nr:winged helix-turn-helix transcriptional regulator [Anaerolineae bacterium]